MKKFSILCFCLFVLIWAVGCQKNEPSAPAPADTATATATVTPVDTSTATVAGTNTPVHSATPTLTETSTCTITETASITATSTDTMIVTPTVTPLTMEFRYLSLPTTSYSNTKDSLIFSQTMDQNDNYGAYQNTIVSTSRRILIKFGIDGAGLIPVGSVIAGAELRFLRYSTPVSYTHLTLPTN